MAYTTINKSTDYFNTKLYTGNGSTNAITGVGFQPDWIWIKSRSDTSNHRIYDYIRGGTKTLYSNLTNDEGTNSDAITSFNSDGFTLGGNAQSNGNGLSLASWNWKAGGTGSANTAGSINSTVSVNTTAGFSIVSYTGTGANATVGHGLGVAPKMMIIKNRSASANWLVYHDSIPATDTLILNTAAASASDAAYNNTDPTSSVFSIGNTGSGNGSGNSLIAYCFAEKQGFSKFGSYIGNGNADGPFVYTGFKPAWVMIKNVDSSSEEWNIWDNKRDIDNPLTTRLVANISAADSVTSAGFFDFTSNGFKIRSTANGVNQGSGHKMVYMCFAKAPLVGTNNTPCTAR